jgi:beta-galactosidase
MAWSAVGHGADAIGYWQWRAAPGGQEQYHGTLVGADGTPVPVYDEIKHLGQDFARAAPVLSGSNVVAQVAMLNDYPSRWAIGWQRFTDAYSPADAMAAYYTPLHATARAVDVVADTAALGRYRLVVAPALNVLTAQAAANLIAYVKGGGHLVLGDRSGMKDGDNRLQPQRQPGPLAELLGARVAQWYALDQAVPVAGSWGHGTAALWAERLEVTAPDTQVTLRYGPGNGWLEGQAAAVTRHLGRGSITYVGANLDTGLTRTIIDRLEADSGVAPVLPEAPPQVDVGLRRTAEIGEDEQPPLWPKGAAVHPHQFRRYGAGRHPAPPHGRPVGRRCGQGCHPAALWRRRPDGQRLTPAHALAPPGPAPCR